MKKLLHTIIGLLTMFSQTAYSAPPDPTSYPDVVAIPPPTFSLRSLFTGAPISNHHYGQRNEKNSHWTLVDITIKGQRFVQFKAFGTEKCFTGGKLLDCSDYGFTAFHLVPTDTGAFIIQRGFTDGACLLSRDFGRLQFEQCLRPPTNPVDLPFLWALVPPFGQGKLLKVPTP